MTTITLRNFRSYVSEKTFQFQPNNLVHLTGDSGKGKSTLLTAFEWCLYGNPKGVKPKGDPLASPQVKIIFPNSLEITRQGSNTLLVKTPDGIDLTADAGQGYICSIFGSSELWKCGSYLQAECRNSLLVGSGEDKLKILREIAYGYGIGEKEDPEHYLGVVYDAISKCKKDLIGLKAVYETCYDETNDTIDKFNESENRWLEANTDIISLKKEITETRLKLKEASIRWNEKSHLISEKKSLERSLRTLSEINFDEIESIDLDLSIHKDRLKNYDLISKIKLLIPYEIDSEKYHQLLLQNDSRKKWDKRIRVLGLNISSLDDINRLRQQYDNYKQWKEFCELRDEKEYIENLKKFIVDSKVEVEKIESKIASLDDSSDDLDELNFESKKLEKLIEDFEKKKSYICPSCHDRLFMNEQGKLSLGSKVDIRSLKDDLKKIKDKIKTYQLRKNLLIEKDNLLKDVLDSEKEISSLELEFSESRYQSLKGTPKVSHPLLGYSGSVDQLLDDLTEAYVESVSEVELKKLSNGDSLEKLLGDSLGSFLEDPDAMLQSSGSRQDILAKISSCQHKLKQMEEDKAKQKIIFDNLKKIDSRLDVLIETKSSEIDVLEGSLERLRALELDYIRYNEVEEKVEALASHETKMVECSDRLERLDLLYEELKKLSIERVESLIDVINHRLNEYLDRLFDKEPIKVVFSLYKTSTGPKASAFAKISVNLQVYHKNNSYPNILALSSGEKDRLSLAMTLTMADICDSKMIFLDECMASLDSYHREQCLVLLNERLTESVFIIDVCPESVEGYHSEVIRID